MAQQLIQESLFFMAPNADAINANFGELYKTMINNPNNPDTPPANPGTLDDEFNQSSLDLTRWTWVNQGLTSASLQKSVASILVPGSTTDELRFITQPAPKTPWAATMKINSVFNVTSNFASGIFLYDSISGKVINWGMEMNTGLMAYPIFEVNQWNSVHNSFNAGVFQLNMPSVGWYYLRVQDDGTNLNFSLSWDGINFLQLYSQGRTSFLPNGANQVGLGGDTSTPGGASILLVNTDWFRRTQ